MSQQRVAESSSRLIEAAVANLWRQWQRAGASTNVNPGSTAVIVDPEVLILGSLALAGQSARLSNLAEEWTVANDDLVSVGRLKSLRSTLVGNASHDSLEDFASRVFARTGNARWRTLCGSKGESTARQRRSTTKAARPKWATGATLMLQLRLALGVGVKSDVLTVLLGSAPHWLGVADLSDKTGYSDPAVREALSDLAEAGWLHATGDHIPAYCAVPSQWTKLLPSTARPTPVWRDFYAAMRFVLDWRSSPNFERLISRLPHSASLAADRCRALTRQHARLFAELGVELNRVRLSETDPWSSGDQTFTRLEYWFNES
jgi:hypothetical protein